MKESDVVIELNPILRSPMLEQDVSHLIIKGIRSEIKMGDEVIIKDVDLLSFIEHPKVSQYLNQFVNSVLSDQSEISIYRIPFLDIILQHGSSAEILNKIVKKIIDCFTKRNFIFPQDKEIAVEKLKRLINESILLALKYQNSSPIIEVLWLNAGKNSQKDLLLHLISKNSMNDCQRLVDSKALDPRELLEYSVVVWNTPLRNFYNKWVAEGRPQHHSETANILRSVSSKYCSLGDAKSLPEWIQRQKYDHPMSKQQVGELSSFLDQELKTIEDSKKPTIDKYFEKLGYLEHMCAFVDIVTLRCPISGSRVSMFSRIPIQEQLFPAQIDLIKKLKERYIEILKNALACLSAQSHLRLAMEAMATTSLLLKRQTNNFVHQKTTKSMETATALFSRGAK